MLKQAKSPDGYKHLLVYKKAEELLAETLNFTATFPHEKTINDLEDQMNRSVRSVKANIVEGWKRNATHEYYTFLGYSIASNTELLEDYLDICLGRYEAKGLPAASSAAQAGVKGVNGINGATNEKGAKGGNGKQMSREELESFRFYPLDSRLPLSVQLYLRAKELNMLLDKLQVSLVERITGRLSLPTIMR